jgi:hypothetical protein
LSPGWHRSKHVYIRSATKRETSFKRRAKAKRQKPHSTSCRQLWAQTNGPQGGDGIALATNPSGTCLSALRGAVFSITDNGESWTGIHNGLTDTNVRALAISGVGQIFAGTFSGAFRSIDNGDTWVAINTRLGISFWSFRWQSIPAETFSRVHLQAVAFIDRLMTATNWTLVDNGLTNTYVTALAINSGGDIFCRDVWRWGVSFDRQRGQLDRT